ncbi:MAG: BsaWI family type II restriction enzyme [Bacteroidia bacterium]|nr:BsaWI family type II restriction enzyme [Bacteroidia bacterium]MDW8417755.1 BsaWI family type II restriction enzyme [Bacteroidia bacterium]
MAPKPVDSRQSEVSRQGKLWEKFVESFIQKHYQQLCSTVSPDSAEYKILEDLGIISLAAKGSLQLMDAEPSKKASSEALDKIYDALYIPIYYRRRKVLGDIDIVLFSKRESYPLVVVSCKLSLHGRLTETLFYALYYRFTRKIKFVLATPDKGKQSKESLWESEWGTHEKPSKDRLLASVFLDGVYVQNAPEFMPKGFDSKKHGTVMGGIIRPLEHLLPDTLRWYQEILT